MADSHILLNKPKLKEVRFPFETVLLFEVTDSPCEQTMDSTKASLQEVISKYPNITCVGFDCDNKLIDKMMYFCKHIKLTTDLKTIWYNCTGIIPIDKNFKLLHWIDYIFIDDFDDDDIACRFQVINKGDDGFVLENIL